MPLIIPTHRFHADAGKAWNPISDYDSLESELATAGVSTLTSRKKMSYILSANRDHDSFENACENWENYQSYLRALKDKLATSAFEIATSSWWYQFDLPEAPHDSRLNAFRMGDHGAPAWDNQKYSWIEIELHSAYSGTILLRYSNVSWYELRMSNESQGVHGDWRYDEFSLSAEGNLLHTIEWADGAVWVIEASDLKHQYIPEPQDAEGTTTSPPVTDDLT